MSTAKTQRNSVRATRTQERDQMEDINEIARNAVDHLTEWARDNPRYAALVCLGVGFVLGWKLKPW